MEFTHSFPVPNQASHVRAAQAEAEDLAGVGICRP